MSSSPFDPLDPLGGGDGGLGAFISSSGLIGGGSSDTNGDTQFGNNGNVGGGNVSAVSSQSTMANSNNMNMMMVPMGMGVAGGMVVGGGPGNNNNNNMNAMGPVSGGMNMGMNHAMGIGMGTMNHMGIGLAGDSSFFCRCHRCGYGNADVQLVACGCSFHR